MSKSNKFLPLVLGVFTLSISGVSAQETDFSCIEVEIKDKQQVSERYVEFDVIMKNTCPGAVHWAACVETLDPWSHKIYTPLTPTGLLDKDKRSKVNVQMKKVEIDGGARHAYQKFYVNTAFSLEPIGSAQCMARSCEAMKTELRGKVRANDRSLQSVLKTMEADITETCPKTSWSNESQEACIEGVREKYQPQLLEHSNRLDQLESDLQAVDPVNCQVYGGS